MAKSGWTSLARVGNRPVFLNLTITLLRVSVGWMRLPFALGFPTSKSEPSVFLRKRNGNMLQEAKARRLNIPGEASSGEQS